MTQKVQREMAVDQVHPPCQSACPLHQGCRDYLLAIATGDFDRALAIIKETNPLPFVCGTICAHHCEDECRRNDVDKPPSIRGLKRFAAEYGKATPPPPPEGQQVKGKVAVIGAGPAGLTAAYDLARLGAAVTVFEREGSAGGAVRHYIPLYRLPDEAVDKDISEIAAQGVEFKYGVELGKDFTIEQLENDGYQAVLLAMGLPVSRGLNIPGSEGEGILYALPFLQAVKREDFKFEGAPTVIVIGGGNVAMDVARSAVRAGAGKVKLACLECDEEMPAFDWEIEEAREEGIEFNTSWGPDAIVREEDGKVKGLELVECTCVFDEQGRFDPKLNKDCRETVEGDIVIFSIGQGGDPDPVRGELDIDERGRLAYNQRTMATSRKGVFGCGEMVTGPGTAVQSMANGRLAAQAVVRYLEGLPFDSEALEELPVLEKLDPTTAAEITPSERLSIPIMTPEERVRHFKQAELGYEPLEAVREARRCLTCAAGARRIDELCVNCLTCVRICPYKVPVINDEGTVSIRNEQCQACGLCLSICPVYAIEFRTSYVEEAVAAIEPAVRKAVAERNGKPAMLAITCAYGAFALPSFTESDHKGTAVVRYPCVGKLDTLHLLRAIELGIDGIVVVGCSESEQFSCPYKEIGSWTGKRVAHAGDLLEALGMERDKISYAELAGEEIDRFDQIIEEAAGRIVK